MFLEAQWKSVWLSSIALFSRAVFPWTHWIAIYGRMTWKKRKPCDKSEIWLVYLVFVCLFIHLLIFSLSMMKEPYDWMHTGLLWSTSLSLRPGWVIFTCSWARHFTFTSPLPTQECKWVLENWSVAIRTLGGGWRGGCSLAIDRRSNQGMEQYSISLFAKKTRMSFADASHETCVQTWHVLSHWGRHSNFEWLLSRESAWTIVLLYYSTLTLFTHWVLKERNIVIENNWNDRYQYLCVITVRDSSSNFALVTR